MSLKPSNASTLTTPSDRELQLVREFDAPRELLWKVWTDPEHLKKWWGPTGFSTTTHDHDAAQGGSWRCTMHGPDGHDYPNHIKYTALREPEFIAYQHIDVPNDVPACFRAEATFEQISDTPARTRMTFRMIFDTPEDMRTVVEKFGAGAGAVQTFNRLERHVTSLINPPDREPFSITRVFDAPPQLVYDAWTKREHLIAWFGPKGVSLDNCTLDLREGGSFHYEMKSPMGSMWGIWRFLDVRPPELIEFISSFSDEDANITRAPFEGRWPLEMYTLVTFEPHAGLSGGTVLRLESTPINADAQERDTFFDGRESMRQGWGGTLDELTTFLESLKASKG